MHAELAYLFRHALMRDAAYDLQLPSDRAKLHELAYGLIEELLDGPPPDDVTLESGRRPFAAHRTDSAAAELAHHARNAASLNEAIWQEREAHYLGRAAEHAQAGLRSAEALGLYERLQAITPPNRVPDIQRRKAAILLRVGRTAEALTTLKLALVEANRLGDEPMASFIYAIIAIAHYYSGESDAAESAARKAIDWYEAKDDAHGVATNLMNLSLVCSSTGRRQEAETLLARARVFAEKAADTALVLSAMGNLAVIYQNSDRVDQALAIQEECIGIARADDRHHRQLGVILGNHATALAKVNRTDEAIANYEEATSILLEVGEHNYAALALANLAMQLSRRGRKDKADRLFADALQSYEISQNKRLRAVCLCQLANHNVLFGNVDAARTLWKEGMAALAEFGDTANMELMQKELAYTCNKTGIATFDDEQGAQ